MFAKNIMKKILLWSLITLSLWSLLAATSSSALAQVPSGCPTNISNYWKLDDTTGSTFFTDSVGGNDADCTSTSCPDVVSPGKINSALLFNGIDDGISVPAAASFDWGQTDSFSIEFWMKTDSASTCSGSQVAIGRNDGLLQWWAGCWDGGKAAFVVQDKDGNLALLEGTTDLTDGSWHHIAAVRDAGTNEIRLYVNGIQEASVAAAYTSGFDSATAALNIGWFDYPSSTGFHFNGTIDEVALYNKALSEVEIRSHYYLARGYCDMCSTPVRIMPLGDSITNGNGPITDVHYQVGYRQKLYLDLKNSGYNVDFVGSLNSGDLATPTFDSYHEGHPGFLADLPGPLGAQGIAPNIYNWLLANPADVILLHIGTNDVPGYADPTKVGRILDNIDLYSKDTTVLLARIILKEDTPSDATATITWNDGVENIAIDRIGGGDKIIRVDQQDVVSYPNDYNDPLHPNQTGYEKMATAWLNSLKTFLPVCSETPPSIYSVPPSSAAVGYPYVYDVDAVGVPLPTYSLLTAPPAMTIDSETGLIQWTPVASGTADVTVRAENSLDYDDQIFAINVLTCPLGMLHYWELGESTPPYEELFGSSKAVCTTCSTPTTGIADGGQQFSASSQVNVPSDASFDWGQTDSFSIEFWMKTDSASTCSGNQVAIGRNDGLLQWWAGCWDGGKAAFVVQDKDGNLALLEGTTDLTDGSWHHIAAVRDAGTNEIRLYVNGIQEASVAAAYTSGFDSATAALNIGWLNLNGGYHFVGAIDEVALYKRTLSDAEIQQHFTNAAVGKGYCYGYYLVTPSATGNGSISPSTLQTVVSDGSTSFTLTPDFGYHIGSVTGCGTLTGNTYTTGPITGDCAVTATFVVNDMVKRVSGATSAYFSVIQTAYENENTVDGDTLQSQIKPLDNELNFDRDIGISLTGGYDADFGSQTGYTTVGTMTISKGTVIVDGIVIQ